MTGTRTVLACSWCRRGNHRACTGTRRVITNRPDVARGHPADFRTAPCACDHQPQEPS